jgi:hypothetical protein
MRLLKVTPRAYSFLLATLLLAPAGASARPLAQPLLPPDNSAANQYTEAYPTSGGEKPAIDRSETSKPAEVIGARSAEKLEEAGPEGRDAALLAAETTLKPSQREGGASRGPKGQGQEKTRPSVAKDSEGSSGLSEVLLQATGLSSSSQSGFLALLLIASATIGSLAYLWKRKRPVA